MKHILLLAVVAMLACGPAHATWTTLLDGQSMPGSPWEADGSASLVTAFDGSKCVELSSGADYAEYYLGPGTDQPIAVAGARFSLKSFSTTGTENIVQVNAGLPAGAPCPGISLYNGHYWVWDYMAITLATNKIYDLGAATADQFHTVYLRSDQGATSAASWMTVVWDGVTVVDKHVSRRGNGGGWVEWGSGTGMQDSASTVVDFDWVGYGDSSAWLQAGPPSDAPEPGSLAALAFGLFGLAGFIRRRK